MIADLDQVSHDVMESADVVVVGAGLAGLAIASQLARSGLRVVVLESGGASQTDDTHELNTTELEGHPYRGALEGRFRCLGGTSTRWGGALLPFLEDDLGDHTAGWMGSWGVAPAELLEHLPAVERLFGLMPGPYEIDQGQAVSPAFAFALRSPKWPHFANRNIANVLRSDLANSPNLHIWLNATAVDFQLAGTRCSKVVGRSRSEKAIYTTAKSVVIAAGAIESTRILLLLDRANNEKIFGPDSALGRYFSDHISAPVADIEPLNVSALNRLFGFRFVRGGMRNIRLEINGAARRSRHLPGAFAHVAAVETKPGGFSALRALFQSIQQRRAPRSSDIARLLRAAPWLLKAAYSRFVERTVAPPEGAAWQLHLITEQKPIPGNQIRLSKFQSDRFGQPLAHIKWQVGPADTDVHRRIAGLLFAEWEQRGYDRLGRLAPRSQDRILHDLIQGGGIFHPSGSTRIGAHAKVGVVDRNLRAFGIDNLRVVSTSAFPSGGGANPTLMLMLFAMRASRQIIGELRGLAA